MWVVEVLRVGYRIPFVTPPPLSTHPVAFHSYFHSSVKAQALEEELSALLSKGAVEPAPTSPGFYSRMFVVQKASGAWRPIINLSHMNKYIVKTKFRMETVQSVLGSLRRGDWMFSLDLKDDYLQVPIHESSRKFLRFVTSKGVFQFRVLCFGLTTAPQVFTRVMAPVATIQHSLGIRMLRYIDDWLVLASSVEECLRARDTVLSLCAELGIQLNLEKSSLTPSQISVYLGIELNSVAFKASPSLKRRDSLSSIIGKFLSSREQPASLWRSLLGHLASLTPLVPGGRLWTRSLQLVLRSLLEFSGRRSSHSLERGMQRGSALVVSRRSPRRGSFSQISPPRPSVVVRRFGSGLGRFSSGRR